jgi:hypothetical protein
MIVSRSLGFWTAGYRAVHPEVPGCQSSGAESKMVFHDSSGVFTKIHFLPWMVLLFEETRLDDSWLI